MSWKLVPKRLLQIENLEARHLLATDVSGLALERGDFDNNRQLTATDLDLLAGEIRATSDNLAFDTNRDGQLDFSDFRFWVEKIHRTYSGDANLDGQFGSSDLVTAFQVGLYEQDLSAGWADGDWNGDGRFSSGDLVSAFQSGTFEKGPRGISIARFDLSADSDSTPTGDRHTTQPTVTLLGNTDPFTVIELVGRDQFAEADIDGKFLFSDIDLAKGVNAFTARVHDINGNFVETELFVTHSTQSNSSPWGDFVTSDILNPEYLAVATTAFLPTSVSALDLANEIAETATESNSVLPPAIQLTPLDESEDGDASGSNDTISTAEWIEDFGTASAQESSILIQGVLAPEPAIISVVEDNGDITKATEITTELVAQSAVLIQDTIGNGPFGSNAAGNGDFDFFAIRNRIAGQVITLDVNTPVESELDSFMLVYDSDGDLVDVSDDDRFSTDSFLKFNVPADGDYFVSIAGFGSFGPVDPFDSSSGFGADSEGDYSLIVSLEVDQDIDYFSVDLQSGDILGAAVTGGATHLTFYDHTGSEIIGSRFDATFLYPDISPLPRHGNAAISSVVATDGTYFITVDEGVGSYGLQMSVFRPVLESQPRDDHQILFLDFDGASLNAVEDFGGGNEHAQLSPLSMFLEGWGLGPEQEDDVIDAIVATVEENFADIGTMNINGDRATDHVDGNYQIEITTSRDATNSFGFATEMFGQPNVSRVIVGGSITELGLTTIGIANAIDVGNFETRDSAVVLLDLLSAPAGNPNSLNQFGIDPNSSKIELIGVGVGNIIAHEAGHLFGNWHTQNFNSVANIMDQGGSLSGLVGVGADRVFGSDDDIDVDFGVDEYVENEAFTGIENTASSIAFGLSTGTVDQGMIVVASDPSLGRQLDFMPTEFSLEFLDEIDTANPLAASDLLVNGIPADSVQIASARSLKYSFENSPVDTPGLQTLQLSADSVRRISDGDGVDAFNSDFGFDDLQMEVAAFSPADASHVELPFGTISVTFNEPYHPNSVGINDLVLSEGTVTSFTLVNDNTIEYSVSGQSTEAALHVELPDGAVTDVFGNLAIGFSATYSIDIGTVPFTTPLIPKLPLGSLIYDPPMNGGITVDDTDQFSVMVDPGQTISVLVTTDPSLQANLVLSTAGRTIGSTQADAAGTELLLQSNDVNGRFTNRNQSAAEYTVRVSGVDGSTGSYELQLVLNTAIEDEFYQNPLDVDSQQTQDLEIDIVKISSSNAQRAAVIGDLLGPAIIRERFDTLELSSNWQLSSSSQRGRIEVTGQYGTSEGDFALLMDTSRIVKENLNEAIWQVQIPNGIRPVLNFSHARFGDERNPFDGDFTGSFNADGIAISNDGEHWHPIFDAPSSPFGAWNRHNIDLANEIIEAEMTLNAPLFIKFQQFDNFPLQFDGRGWDDISITVDDPADYYSFELGRGETITLAATAQQQGDVQIDILDSSGTVIQPGLLKPIVNGSFETGDFLGWSTNATATVGVPWQIASAGAGGDFGIETTSPIDGNFVAWNGFDGDGPMRFTLNQDVSIPADAPRAIFEWQHRIQWLFVEPGAAARSFSVDIVEPATGDLLERAFTFSTGSEFENPLGDTGWQNSSIDLSAYTGSTVRVQFVEEIPESFTGPGQVEIDAIKFDVGQIQVPQNVSDMINAFTAQQSDTFVARITGITDTDYTLIATRNADFSFEHNDHFTEAQPLLSASSQGRQWVLGHVEESGSDYFRIFLGRGQPATFSTITPGDKTGEFVNDLDPQIRLYDSGGDLVAEDDNSAADGRNSFLRYRVPRGDEGIYYIEIASSSLTPLSSGEYVLSLQGVGREPLAAMAAGAVVEDHDDNNQPFRIVAKPVPTNPMDYFEQSAQLGDCQILEQLFEAWERDEFDHRLTGFESKNEIESD